MSVLSVIRGRMSPRERGLTALAGILVLTGLVLPIWRFHLWAPQYPEGLGLDIYARSLQGQVQNINILNHYVGMRPLSAAAFPEFGWMAPLIAAVGGLLLVCALVGRRELDWLGWLALFAFDLGMMSDFAGWLYRWGHDLNPRAPIHMPPFTPPVIGWKHIANFFVYSFPSWGGVAIVLASGLGAYVLWRGLREP